MPAVKVTTTAIAETMISCAELDILPRDSDE